MSLVVTHPPPTVRADETTSVWERPPPPLRVGRERRQPPLVRRSDPQRSRDCRDNVKQPALAAGQYPDATRVSRTETERLSMGDADVRTRRR